MARRLFFGLTMIAGMAASVASCTTSLGLDDNPCPCADGWTCCPGTNVCVAGGLSACPGAAVSPDGAPPDGGDGAASFTAGPVNVGWLASDVLANKQSPRCMAADRDHVYWQNADGRVWAAQKTGGTTIWAFNAVPRTESVSRCAMSVPAFGPSRIYLADFDSGEVSMLPLTAPDGTWGLGDWVSLATMTTPSSLFAFYGGSAASISVYVTEYEAGRISMVAPPDAAGAGKTLVVKDGLLHPDDIAFSRALVWINRGTDPAHGSEDGTIARMYLDGGLTTLVGPQGGLDDLVENGGTFWLDELGVHVIADDAGPATLLASSTGARLLTPDPVSSVLYWIASQGLQQLPLGGSVAPRTVNVDVTGVTGLAVYNGRVFMATAESIKVFPPN